MKAMILAAGLGKRLRPYTLTTPKALFPIGRQPIIDRAIRCLQQAGCDEIMINTHHLAEQIHEFIFQQDYDVPVRICFEDSLLGTGGAIKNVADFWDDSPFMVINGDIIIDIDFKALYRFHLDHADPVTLVLYDDADFNTVAIDRDGFVSGFDAPAELPSDHKHWLTFACVHVINPEVLGIIPNNQFSDIIDTYIKLMASGKKIRSYTAGVNYWKDIGTPDHYRQAAYDQMSTEAFALAFPDDRVEFIERVALSGDGSDRSWYRLLSGNRSMIMVDHGIRSSSATVEADAFIHIGSHLRQKKVPVPAIYHHDAFSGLVFMEDLGDTHLQDIILNLRNTGSILEHYRAVIQLLIEMSQSAISDFHPGWAYQTTAYDQSLILDKECRYFIDAFICGYLNRKADYEDFLKEFLLVADRALEFSVEGFMHRDFQSRNIMVKENEYHFIDFQGGRIGPLQYDLASLLIDPYVALPDDIQTQLVDFCIQQLIPLTSVKPADFRNSYDYCAVSRNLQILGAFGFLTRIKGKPDFESYIPQALKTLKHHFLNLSSSDFPKLKTLIDSL